MRNELFIQINTNFYSTCLYNGVDYSHQTQHMKLNGQVVLLLSGSERESTCFDVVKHLLHEFRGNPKNSDYIHF